MSDPGSILQTRLFVHGIRLVGPHGVYEEEQQAGNEFSIDLEMEGDLRTAVARDCLQNTVNYDLVVALIRDVHRQQQFSLIESFADAIARALLVQFSLLSRVSVRVTKLTLRRLDAVREVSAEVVRGRT